MKEFFIFTDGGSRGNPGPAAIGIVIKNNLGKIIFETGERLGSATNNVAEYRAVVRALLWVVENQKILNDVKISFFLDSLLIYSQIVGAYKVKDSKMKELLSLVRKKEDLIKTTIFYKHIPREKNKEADRMVNLALDNLI